MSLHILDTDILTLAQKNHPLVLQHLRSLPSTEIATTILSIQEQLDGWHDRIPRAKNPRNLARIYQRFTDSVRYLARVPIISFDESAIARHEDLKRLKLTIGKMDLRIAAIVLEHNATLVSRNLRDFRRVPGLQVEDWSV